MSYDSDTGFFMQLSFLVSLSLFLCNFWEQVKSRDHEFESVPHLVDYFTSRDVPLVIGKSQVFLRQPVINAYPT